MPTISDIPNQTINEDAPTSALAFMVGDAETAAASLTVSGSSSNTTLVPNANIVFGGSGANRTVTVTPAANQFGTATITVSVSDGSLSASDTFVLTVNAVNDVPTISDITSQTINEDSATSALSFTVDDVETPAARLTVSGTSSDTSLVPNTNIVFGGSGANRTVTVTPAANQFGTATITVAVSDGTDTVSDTFLLTVTSVNDTPIGLADSYSFDEDSTLSIVAPGVLENDTDADVGSSLTAILISPPPGAAGAFSLQSNGAFTFTPAVNFTGTTSFTYLVFDGGSVSGLVTAALNVLPVNDAPVFTGAPYSLNATEDSAFSGQLAASDVDAGETATLTFAKVSGPTWLSVSPTGELSGTPINDNVGSNSFTVSVFDGTAVVTTSLAVTVANTNDAPVFTGAPYSLNATEDSAFTGQLAATDVDAGETATLIFAKVSGPAWLSVSPTGELSGTPINDNVGSNSFTVNVSDGIATVTASLTITVGNTNDAPIATGNAYSTQEDTTLSVTAPGVIGNDSDVDIGTVLSAVLVTAPPVSEGTLVLNANGSFTFSPALNFNGISNFTYRASDGELVSEETTVAITVTPVNDAPVAFDDSFVTDEDTSLVITLPQSLLANDTDSENSPLTVIVGEVQPEAGYLELSSDGTFTYTPESDFHGTVSFTYQVTDGELISNFATVSLQINPVNDAPVAQSNTYHVVQGKPLSVPLSFGLLWNDSDAEGQALTALLVTPPLPAQGTLQLNSDGTFSFTPDPAFVGTATFTYSAFDGQLPSNPTTVTLFVSPDSDGDSLDDAWELANFGNLASTANGDNDGDGESNADEMVFGTSPNLAESSQRPQMVVSGTGMTLLCRTTSTRLYQIQVSTQPGNLAVWTDLFAQPILGDGSIKIYNLPVPTGSVFYRIAVSR